MTVVVPFEYQPHLKDQEPYTVYMVNEDNPRRSGYVQGMQECPHCNEKNHFRVYDGEEITTKQDEMWRIDYYDCKCPACKKEFMAEYECFTGEIEDEL